MKILMWKQCPFIFICLIFSLGLNQQVFSQTTSEKPLYQDYNQPVKARVRDLLSRMTLEEKLIQMISRIDTAIPRLGIPRYHWGGEAGHCIIARANDAATIFPVGIAQAATWNRKLNRAIGDAMSTEAWPRFRAKLDKSTLTFWAPVVEMARDPRWGRTEECYGEDPFLTAQLSMEFVRGIQGDHPKYLKGIAAPKHFALNNEEWCRHNGSSNVDEQLLREYYLKPYQVLVQEGKAEQIMAAYNRINGVPCAGNKWLLTDVLRKDWGFDGTVVSDCNGVRDFYEGHKYVANVEDAIALALNSGMDIECGDCFKDHLADVVRKGLVSEAVIDSAVSRILASRFKLGLMDPDDLVPFTKIPMSVVDGPVHRELARQASRESIVLLRNENKLLPLNKDKIKTIAVIGPGAKVCQLGGYSGGCSKAVSPFDGIVNKLGADKVKFVRGTDVKIKLPLIPSKYLIPADGKPGEHGLKGEYFKQLDCSGDPVLVRVDSLLNFNFGKGSPTPEMPKDYFSIRWTGKLIAPVSGDYYIGGEFDDAIRLYIDGKKIIDRTNNRNTSSDAVKIELEKGKQYDLKIEYNEQWHVAIMKLSGAAPVPDKFKEAIEAARNSDVAVVVLGTDETIEKEGIDRADMNLPGDQEDLLKAVYQANPNTILVMQNGSAMSINWASQHVAAVLEAWYGGEETGNAIADVLFGDYNPAGRLPLTFYQSVDQLPSISDYDIRKGRTYMYPKYKNEKGQTVEVKPLYPFGYGLSYTQFAYSNLKVGQTTVGADGNVKVSVDLRNSGKLLGDEVVQVYMAEEKPDGIRPVKQLVGFDRVSLQSNQVKTIEFEIPVKSLAYWDVTKKTFLVKPGRFSVMIGSSSQDIKLSGHISVK
jgi:beta-glucosidase